MAHILVIGNATLDIVSTVDHYPAEDEELRASARHMAPGGNAANTARVLARLGHRTDLMAVLAREPDGERLSALLHRDGVGLAHCVRRDGSTPCSHVILSARTGSRTIVHFRDLPEAESADLRTVPVEHMDWVHVETRDARRTGAMLRALRGRLVDQPVSLEVEKERDGVDALFDLADVVLFSRPFARGRGFSNAAGFLEHTGASCPGRIRVCTWGGDGAWALDLDGRLHHAPAVSPPRVMDTLGAGDTFNAGLIHGLAEGRNLPESLAMAVGLAGRKVGRAGLDGLEDTA